MIDDNIRAMPHSLGPEKAVISLLLQNNLVFYTRFAELGMRFEMFYLPAHLKIAQVILEYCNAGEQIEMISLIQKLMDKSFISDIGGPAAVTELFSYAPMSANFEGFCEEIKVKYIARQMYVLCHEVQGSDLQSKDDVQLQLGIAESRLSELQSTLHPMAASNVRMAVESVLEDFRAVIDTDDTTSLYGLKTGFEKTDNMLMGLNPTNLYIIGARPSVGKTSYLLNIIDRICLVDENPTLIFSLEMSMEQLVKKLIYSRANLSYHKLIARGANKYIPSKIELNRMKDSMSLVNKSPLYIDDKSGVSIEYIMATARRYKRDFGIKCIALDYLQLAKSNSKKSQQSKNIEVSEISSGLKQIAKELNIPVIALSQLNRDASGGSKPMPPKLHHLRDSGSLEQDADVIGLLHRFDYEGATERKGEAQINWSKNRHGPTGIIELSWLADVTQFQERITQY